MATAKEAIEADNPGMLHTCLASTDLHNEGRALLELAGGYGQSGCVKVLLDGGCNPNLESTREDGLSPLHLAAKYGHHE